MQLSPVSSIHSEEICSLSELFLHSEGEKPCAARAHLINHPDKWSLGQKKIQNGNSCDLGSMRFGVLLWECACQLFEIQMFRMVTISQLFLQLNLQLSAGPCSSRVPPFTLKHPLIFSSFSLTVVASLCLVSCLTETIHLICPQYKVIFYC